MPFQVIPTSSEILITSWEMIRANDVEHFEGAARLANPLMGDHNRLEAPAADPRLLLGVPAADPRLFPQQGNLSATQASTSESGFWNARLHTCLRDLSTYAAPTICPTRTYS